MDGLLLQEEDGLVDAELVRRCEAVLDWKPSAHHQVASVLRVPTATASALCAWLVARGRACYLDEHRLVSHAHLLRNPR